MDEGTRQNTETQGYSLRLGQQLKFHDRGEPFEFSTSLSCTHDLHLSNKHNLSTDYMPGTVLDTGDTELKET